MFFSNFKDLLIIIIIIAAAATSIDFIIIYSNLVHFNFKILRVETKFIMQKKFHFPFDLMRDSNKYKSEVLNLLQFLLLLKKWIHHASPFSKSIFDQ